jgi:hypothetical protein
MKHFILAFIVMVAFAGCTEPRFDVQYQDVRKVIITGLPAVTNSGEDIQVEIGYVEAGKSLKTSKELYKRTTESVEYVFPKNIDIYLINLIPDGNPPGYRMPCTFVDKVLTIDVQKR